MDNKNIKVLLFFVEGFEELEAMAPVDLLRRAGIEVDTVSITQDKHVISSRKITVLADKIIDDVDFEEYKMLVLPGGPGTDNYMKSKKLLEKVKEFSERKKVAAICAAPTILSRLGILKGKKAICFPSCEEEIVEKGAVLTKENVVTDGNIITSRGAGTAIDFALEIIRELEGKEKSQKIAKQIVYK
ncbi:DJ-1/PfpI family protein [Leptotrichia sp. OH3620_COT-345]|uniref:DJ-1 family glyoxalase III n=1 Tax=Leptotrichia sp. OH3620_COT-345 TaxID=2491048 RepID=UPI000F650629|nr:DJ-1 family glyoxalase III [Leptotrichia sp. OH3620_COT-345]RRD41092.1 DJ-1/PfpI family protein [Leptotrichia sp. OH3620_COT-345]